MDGFQERDMVRLTAEANFSSHILDKLQKGVATEVAGKPEWGDCNNQNHRFSAWSLQTGSRKSVLRCSFNMEKDENHSEG